MKQQVQKNVRRYTAIFEQDATVGGYTVTIPALPGCISEGNTFEDALKNIEEAAALYLEVMHEQHEDVSREENSLIIAPVHVPT